MMMYPCIGVVFELECELACHFLCLCRILVYLYHFCITFDHLDATCKARTQALCLPALWLTYATKTDLTIDHNFYPVKA